MIITILSVWTVIGILWFGHVFFRYKDYITPRNRADTDWLGIFLGGPLAWLIISAAISLLYIDQKFHNETTPNQKD